MKILWSLLWIVIYIWLPSDIESWTEFKLYVILRIEDNESLVGLQGTGTYCCRRRDLLLNIIILSVELIIHTITSFDGIWLTSKAGEYLFALDQYVSV